MRAISLCVTIGLVAVAWLFATPRALGQGTLATYQGRLQDGLSAYTGLIDVSFTIFNDPVGGTALVGTQTVTNVQVTNGLFNVAFDPGSLGTSNAWLSINVRAPAGVGNFLKLGPRQQITAAPVAASLVGLDGGTAAEINDPQQAAVGGTAGVTGGQSFVAGTSGLLSAVDLWLIRNGIDDTGTLIVTIFSSTGQALGSSQMAFDGRNDGFRRVDFSASGIRLQRGVSYTIGYGFQFNRPIGVAASNTDVYPGGQLFDSAGVAVPNRDLTFRVVVRPDRFSTDRWLGIGVGVPAVPLHVAGRAILGDTTMNGGLGVSGAVGIGTSTPVTALQVNDGGAFFTGNGAIGLPSGAGVGLRVHYEPSFNAGQIFAFDYSTGLARNLILQAPGGRTGIGTSQPIAPLHVRGNVNTLRLEGVDHTFIELFPSGPTTRGAYLGFPAPGSFDFNLFNERPGGMLNLSAATVRVIGTFVNQSDARDKHDVRDLAGAAGLVDRLRGVRFVWNDSTPDGVALPTGEQIGFLAQEVETVLPELVATDALGRKAVSYVNIVPLLVEALKEERRARAAETRALQARLDRLEQMMTTKTTFLR